MKKNFLPLVSFIVISLILIVALYSPKPKPKKDLTKQNITNVKFLDVNSSIIIKLQGPGILHVFSTWCETCKYDLLKLQNIRQMYDIEIVGLLFNDSLENVLDWQSKGNNVYNKIVKPDDEGVIQLAVLGTPETLLIDQKGDIIFNHKGELNKEEIDAIRSKLTKLRLRRIK